MIYYLPSCKIKALHNNESLIIQNYIKNKGVNILGCCRQQQKDFFTEEDIIINNCTSCAIITDETQPKARELSLYEYILNDNDFPWINFNNEKVTIQDCLRANHKPEVQNAVRECLKRMNFDIVELKENFDKCKFDGPFIYIEPSASNLNLAPKYFNYFKDNYYNQLSQDEIKVKMIEHCKQYTTDRIVVYCNSCLKGVQLGEKNGIHIVDLIAQCINKGE